MPSITRTDLDPESALHKRILSEVRRRVRLSEREFERNIHATWRQNDETMVAYVHESEADIKRDNKRQTEGKQAYTTIRVPYAYGVAMSLHAYLVSVFLSRAPVFQFDGIHGEAQNQVMALEALIDYQYRVAQMGPVMFCWLFDLVKYGIGVIGEYWTTRIRHVAEIIPSLDPLTGEVVKYEQVTRPVPGYKGNEIFNVSPFDFLPDPRVSVQNFQKGEFCATRQRLSWQTIKEREQLGYYTNIEHIDKKIVPNFPSDNDRDRESRAIQRPADNYYNVELRDTGLGDTSPEIVPVYECYIKIVPSDWNLGNSDFPVMWCFTVTGDNRTVIGAAPFGALHAEFPFHVNQIEFDCHALVNRGEPEILKGIQDTMDWLLNSHMYNVRASSNNLFVVDPLRVNMKDIYHPQPGGVIRKRPGAGMSSDKPIEQLQISDITQRNIGDMELMKNIGEQGTGISELLMGATPSGGRRTATEARQTAAAGTSRGKAIAEFNGVGGFASLGRHLVQNSQQWYDGNLKLRIVGNLAQFAGEKFVMVDPAAIAGFYDYITVDGALPLDRFAQINLWKEMIAGVLSNEILASQYDIAGIFGWVAQLGGLRNIDSFRIVPTPMAQLQSQNQQGNIVPIKQNNPDNLQQPTQGGPINVSSQFGANG